MLELVDKTDSKSVASNSVRVRVSLRPPRNIRNISRKLALFNFKKYGKKAFYDYLK